jgi:hypothetical protein
MVTLQSTEELAGHLHSCLKLPQLRNRPDSQGTLPKLLAAGNLDLQANTSSSHKGVNQDTVTKTDACTRPEQL